MLTEEKRIAFSRKVLELEFMDNIADLMSEV